jgi:hypothetical protein
VKGEVFNFSTENTLKIEKHNFLKGFDITSYAIYFFYSCSPINNNKLVRGSYFQAVLLTRQLSLTL